MDFVEIESLKFYLEGRQIIHLSKERERRYFATDYEFVNDLYELFKNEGNFKSSFKSCIKFLDIKEICHFPKEVENMERRTVFTSVKVNNDYLLEPYGVKLPLSYGYPNPSSSIYVEESLLDGKEKIIDLKLFESIPEFKLKNRKLSENPIFVNENSLNRMDLDRIRALVGIFESPKNSEVIFTPIFSFLSENNFQYEIPCTLIPDEVLFNEFKERNHLFPNNKVKSLFHTFIEEYEKKIEKTKKEFGNNFWIGSLATYLSKTRKIDEIEGCYISDLNLIKNKLIHTKNTYPYLLVREGKRLKLASYFPHETIQFCIAFEKPFYYSMKTPSYIS